ncbi:hypothetical protein HZS_7558, partial [Henneguya salminicola]
MSFEDRKIYCFSNRSGEMAFVVVSLFLLVILQESRQELCAYLLSDSTGIGYSKDLSEAGYKMTIHGEWSYSKSSYDKNDCSEFDPSWVNPPRLWYSFKNYDNEIACCNLQQHECAKHRNDNENMEDFAKRVLNTCAKFTGNIYEIICHFDKINEINIINQIVLETPGSNPKNSKLIKCNNSKPFKTSWGILLKVEDDNLVTINVETEELVTQHFYSLRGKQLVLIAMREFSLKYKLKQYFDSSLYERMVKFVVPIIIRILLKVSCGHLCAYILNDPDGNIFCQGLGKGGLKITIYGEWSFSKYSTEANNSIQFNPLWVDPPRL